MSRFAKVGIWILIAAAAVVLPLYELADYTEVWQHDGDVILPAIIFLFTGMALLNAKLVAYAVLTLVAVLSAIHRIITPQLIAPQLHRSRLWSLQNQTWSSPSVISASRAALLLSI